MHSFRIGFSLFSCFYTIALFLVLFRSVFKILQFDSDHTVSFISKQILGKGDFLR